ncbi:MAG: bifunctional demethylmenaquinone methyltransferase/2-methoxy-6-polyprenyl-1,4-benzoquinol methylase UbiE [Hyphomicrobiales bacterium]|nr:MAG: bifunctional demethylmenaquinone methyltransferase/2-methoxy-6-polyprenyl-1,4-benzoquinol methylase UbiE [Hyphomicrobiales bacterium]
MDDTLAPEKSAADTAPKRPGGNETVFGFRSVAPGEKQPLVDDVFHTVARRYDLMNDVMSGGMHRVWKDAFVSWLAPPKTGRRPFEVLDVAGGTGDIAFRIVERSEHHAKVTVADINNAMLTVGRERAEQRGLGDEVDFVQGNAESLPFSSNRYDAYTIAFGIRNVPKIESALSEAFRILKPGGRFMCLEFSSVDLPMLDKVYDVYSFNLIPAMGRVFAGDAEPYRYLVESIRTFPKQERFAKMIRDAGFSRVSYRNLAGGAVAMHSGWKL